MALQEQPIDEYTLAAFLSGTLSKEEREEVAHYLATHDEARELLLMAHQAQVTAEKPVATLPTSARPDRPSRRPARPARRPADRLRSLARWSAARYAVAAMLIFSLGLGLRVAFGPPTDALRNQTTTAALELAVLPSAGDLTFQWTAVPSVYQYRLVVWDPAEARVVAQHETQARRVDLQDDFMATLRPMLTVGHDYALRVDAIDAQNRLLQSSEMVQFTLRP